MTLLGHNKPSPTFVGITILMAAAAIMPWLAANKRELSTTTGSAALRADAAQSGLCAYLSLIALVGLAVNAIWRIAWADPVAALAITPLILWEGKEAIRRKEKAWSRKAAVSRSDRQTRFGVIVMGQPAADQSLCEAPRSRPSGSFLPQMNKARSCAEPDSGVPVPKDQSMSSAKLDAVEVDPEVFETSPGRDGGQDGPQSVLGD